MEGAIRESWGLLIAFMEAATEAFIVWDASFNMVNLEEAAM